MGERTTTGISEPDPTEGWNWGAALLTLPWSIAHRSWFLAAPAAFNFIFWTLFLGWGLATADRPRGSPTNLAVDDLISVGMYYTAAFWLGKTMYLGNKGNAIAWKTNKYSTVLEMRTAQRRYAICGLVLSGVGFGVFLLAVYIALQR